jgi:heme-degrading monooxygenase HmoA
MAIVEPGSHLYAMTQPLAPTSSTATRIGGFPPDDASKAAAMGVPGTRVTPGVVSALDGPVLAGPEEAGALTLLHTTFADNAGAQQAYRNFAAAKEEFRTRPGFLRWLTFNDGPHGYALGLWRTTDDVAAFVSGAAHQAMVREQRERHFEYSQFAGVWAAHGVGRRMLYCERCGTPNAAPAVACTSCSNALDDPYAR